jgi:phage protein D
MNQTFEQQTAGDIVAALAAAAGIQMGTQDAGIDLPSYVIDECRSGHEHIRRLAATNGFEFFFDSHDRLVFRKPTSGSAVRTFQYALDILAIQVDVQQPLVGKVEVRGESPASSLGSEKAHWLVKSIDDSLGTAGSAEPILNIANPAVRTKAAADAVAAGTLADLQARAIRGRLLVPGSPEIELGDIVAVGSHPVAELNTDYRVRAICHRFDKRRGFLTRLQLGGLL